MTLIAAIRCDEGIALAADSQETVGDFRKTVQKLSPLLLGPISAIVTGAGNADLIEAFTERLRRHLTKNEVDTLSDFVTEAESELMEFYSSVVPLHKDRTMDLFIAAASSSETGLWESRSATLVPVSEQCELAGWEETLYTTTIRRLCTPTMTLYQSVLAAIHTIVIAEETSNYVRAPIQVAIIRPNGIHLEDQAYIQIMRETLKEYEQEVGRLFLHCSDTGLNLSKFENILVEFCSRALLLHKLQIDTTLREMLRKGLNSEGAGDPYPRIPPGFTLTLTAGDLKDIYTDEEKQALLRRIRQAYKAQ